MIAAFRFLCLWGEPKFFTLLWNNESLLYIWLCASDEELLLLCLQTNSFHYISQRAPQKSG